MSLYTLASQLLTLSRSEKGWHFYTKVKLNDRHLFFGGEVAVQTFSGDGEDSQQRCDEAAVLRVMPSRTGDGGGEPLAQGRDASLRRLMANKQSLWVFSPSSLPASPI